MANWRRILVGTLILSLCLLLASQAAVQAADQNYSEIHAKSFVADIPGKYEIGLSYNIENDIYKAVSTLESIEVLEDLSVKFNFIIAVTESNPNMVPIKASDKGWKSMYLKDDADKKYDHFAGEGAAYQFAELTREGTRAAYIFPAPSKTAKWIMFVDEDQNGVIGPIEIKRQ